MEDLSEILKKLREDKGWSQAELARRSGIEQTTYHRLEKQEEVGKMSITQAEKIANALDISLIDLLTFGSDRVVVVKKKEFEALEAQWKDVPKFVEEVNRLRAEIAFYEIVADGYVGFVMKGMQGKLRNAKESGDLAALARSLTDDERAVQGITKTAFAQTLDKFDTVIEKIIEQRIEKNKEWRALREEMKEFVEKAFQGFNEPPTEG